MHIIYLLLALMHDINRRNEAEAELARRVVYNYRPRIATRIVNKPRDTSRGAISAREHIIYVNSQTCKACYSFGKTLKPAAPVRPTPGTQPAAPARPTPEVKPVRPSQDESAQSAPPANPTPPTEQEDKVGSIQTVSLPERVLVGFWFGWAPRLSMYDIPPEYNIVCVAFLEPDDGGMPRFVPTIPAQELKDGIAYLKSRGTIVLLSLGGAHQGVAIRAADRSVFRQEVIHAVDTYGFMGIDIDLEGRSITAADNRTVVPSVLRELKDFYQSQNKSFFITMAPEFNKLRGPSATYKPIFDGLGNSYDLVMPQYYNQGLDGIWSPTYGRYLSQNDGEFKAEFLYELTTAIINGESDYIPVPARKLAIGLPASPSAALNGYVSDPTTVYRALGRLADDGNAIRGLMTWSINQDAANGYEFALSYAPLIFGQ